MTLHFHWIVSSPGSVPAVSPSDPLNPAPNYNPGPAACAGWRGTTHFTSTRIGPLSVQIVDVHASIFWEYHDPLKDNVFYSGCEAGPDPCRLYHPKGTINWTYSMEENWQGHDCSENRAGSIPAGEVIIHSDQELMLKPDGAGGYFYSGNGFDPTFELALNCVYDGAYIDPTTFFMAPASEHFRVSPDGQSISGSYSYSVFEEGGTHEITCEWDLRRIDPPK